MGSPICLQRFKNELHPFIDGHVAQCDGPADLDMHVLCLQGSIIQLVQPASHRLALSHEGELCSPISPSAIPLKSCGRSIALWICSSREQAFLSLILFWYLRTFSGIALWPTSLAYTNVHLRVARFLAYVVSCFGPFVPVFKKSSRLATYKASHMMSQECKRENEPMEESEDLLQWWVEEDWWRVSSPPRCE